MKSSEHYWLVKQGNIRISLAEQSIFFHVDAEGKEACLLTSEDTKDVTDILTEYSRTLWEQANRKSAPLRNIQEIIDSNYTWLTDQGTLKIIPLPKTNEIKLSITGSGKCLFSMEQSIEIAQVLKHFCPDDLRHTN